MRFMRPQGALLAQHVRQSFATSKPYYEGGFRRLCFMAAAPARRFILLNEVKQCFMRSAGSAFVLICVHSWSRKNEEPRINTNEHEIVLKAKG